MKLMIDYKQFDKISKNGPEIIMKEYIIKHIYKYIMCCLFPILIFCGCNGATQNTAVKASVDAKEAERQKKEELERLTKGDLFIEPQNLTDYASDIVFAYDEQLQQLVYSFTMEQIPQSDDAYVYLFAKESFDTGSYLYGEPVSTALKGYECQLTFSFINEHLFARFIPALLLDGKYVPLGEAIYFSTPESVAQNKTEYPNMNSKKGLLLDPTMLYTDKLTELDVKHAIYNIPLSLIMGETTDETFPTITYTYKGKEYYFNGAVINGYDGLFSYLNSLGMSCTAIILNDWNDKNIEMIHPDARNSESGAYYYMFNTSQPGAVRTLEAIACFLTERYSGKEYGLVHSWVIANEINQQKIWNYMDTEDVDYYAEEFEKAFYIFYQAAKSQYANAGVYFSIDHDWNSNGGNNAKFFNGRELIEAFDNAAKKHGNYDWGIAIHPYPNPISKVRYWTQNYGKESDAKYLSIMNLGVLTDFLKQDKYLNQNNEVRSITITELGFTSLYGEKLQAAAFAYCYYIVDANPYIDAFIMNRQTDAPEEIKQGLAFGIYNYDQSEKYIKEVFQYIDTKQAEEYTEFMLDILGADTIEEALSWAE